MSEAKPTPGPWTQGLSLIGGECVWLDGKTEPVHGMGADHSWIDCGTAANARLIADAGTVFHTTGLTPSQLVERVKELEGALQGLVSALSPEIHGSPNSPLEIARAALSKARPNTAEGE